MVGYQNASKVNQLYSENIELQKKLAKCQNSTINKSKQVAALLESQMKYRTSLEKVRKTLNHLSRFQWKRHTTTTTQPFYYELYHYN